ncbi:hypothetical protein LCGC14_0773180 [marine sediment metagenome]|uniref:Uncharacterized protein n=1 Tax=marine sediment metagenome TaxID=412755 RepID=A0A0F9PXX7_9ZZZZ
MDAEKFVDKEGVKEIIILGTGNSCIYCDFVGEVWGVNGAYYIKKRMPEKHQDKFHLEKLFMCDFMWSAEGQLNFHLGEINNLKKEYGAELISLHPMKLGKHKLECKYFPYKRIVKKFSSDYFTDTITYMIAYALDKYSVVKENEHGVLRPELTRPLRLKFAGVDMCTTLEYQVSKGGVEFWVSKAHTMGAEIEITPGSQILKNPRGVPYGHRRKYKIKDIDPYGVLDGKKQKEEKDELA